MSTIENFELGDNLDNNYRKSQNSRKATEMRDLAYQDFIQSNKKYVLFCFIKSLIEDSGWS